YNHLHPFILLRVLETFLEIQQPKNNNHMKRSELLVCDRPKPSLIPGFINELSLILSFPPFNIYKDMRLPIKESNEGFYNKIAREIYTVVHSELNMVNRVGHIF
ncbi:hypothetical protein ACJX0J_021839, partial [Zea mays]